MRPLLLAFLEDMNRLTAMRPHSDFLILYLPLAKLSGKDVEKSKLNVKKIIALLDADIEIHADDHDRYTAAHAICTEFNFY